MKTLEWIQSDPIGRNELQAMWPRLVAVVCSLLPELPAGFAERYEHETSGRPLVGEASDEVSPPSPAAEREIVVGSTWANCGGGHVIVTGIDDYGVRYSWVSDGARGERTPRLFRERWSHVSDPQPASPDARRKDLCTCGHRREGHVIDGYCLACPNCAGFTDVNAPDPTDPGVIRAAEGAALEPGEYETLGIHERDDTAELKLGNRFTLLERVQANKNGYWHVPPGYLCGSSWVTAVRRVQEQAPQAAFSRDDTIAADCGAFIPAPQAEAATGERADHCPSCYSGNRQRAEGCSDSFHRTARPEVAPATPRSESASHAHWVQVADTRLGQIRGLNKQLDSTRNELHRASIGRNEALAKAAEQSSRITHLEASLETARFEVMNTRQEHDSGRIAELVAANERLKGAQRDCVELQLRCDGLQGSLAAVERERDELLAQRTQLLSARGRIWRDGYDAGKYDYSTAPEPVEEQACPFGHDAFDVPHFNPFTRPCVCIGCLENDGLKSQLSTRTAELEAARAEQPAGSVYNFAKAILHGDADHRRWLLNAVTEFLCGDTVSQPPPPAESPEPAPGVEAPEVKP